MSEFQKDISQYDPLLSIDVEEVLAEFDPLQSVEYTDVVATSVSEATEVISTDIPKDEAIITFDEPISIQKISVSPVVGFVKEFGRYIAISAVVFAVLLVGTNFSAYTSIAWNWVSPESLKASSAEISATLSRSRITVFANETDTGSGDATKQQEADELKKKLEEENISVKENIFSPKKLIPTMPSVQMDLDVTPYDNRIIIPKLGKNIPLVDVDNNNNFDFDHMENIFMQELEKGVIRYPGTATPGNFGNAFVFGHSSNYPWVKGDYNEVFALLDNLEFGDEIIVYYNQHKYTYVIREKKIVRPTDVKAIVRDDSKKELSLMTCWPVGTTLKRMIVSSELKEDAPVK